MLLAFRLGGILLGSLHTLGISCHAVADEAEHKVLLNHIPRTVWCRAGDNDICL